jgi:hypothetical protein
VGAAQHRHDARGPEPRAHRVGDQRGLRKRIEEGDLEVVGQTAGQEMPAGVIRNADAVALFLTPHGDHLRHDAGVIGTHEPRIRVAGRLFAEEIDDADSHTHLMESRAGCWHYTAHFHARQCRRQDGRIRGTVRSRWIREDPWMIATGW